MLDPETKARWYAAMRSGQYKFGKGTLRDPKTGCYCALGVLADITGFEISKNGFDIVVDGKPKGYAPFGKIEVNSCDVFYLNDEYSTENFEDFITKYEELNV